MKRKYAGTNSANRFVAIHNFLNGPLTVSLFLPLFVIEVLSRASFSFTGGMDSLLTCGVSKNKPPLVAVQNIENISDTYRKKCRWMTNTSV